MVVGLPCIGYVECDRTLCSLFVLCAVGGPRGKRIQMFGLVILTGALEASRGFTSDGLKIKDLINEGRR